MFETSVVREKMEDDNQFCLKWNHFQSNITSHFEFLKDNGDFLDVTLVCEGKLIKGHKVILSACSPFFQKIFQENPCKHPVIILHGVTFEHVQYVVSFMYTGQVFIPENQLSKFIKTAEVLQIKGLAPWGTSKGSIHNLPQLSVSSISNNMTTSVTKKRQHYSSLAMEEGETNLHNATDAGSAFKKITKVSCTNNECNSLDTCESKRDSTEYLSDGEVKPTHLYQDKQFEHYQSTPVPGTSYVNQTSLDQETISGVESRKAHSLDPRPCPVCNRIYSNLSNLRQHMRLIHNPKFVTCKLCFKTFKTDLYLRRHLISFHEMNLHQFVSNMHDVTNDDNIYEKYQEQKKKMTDNFAVLPDVSGGKHAVGGVTWTDPSRDFHDLVKPNVLHVGQMYSSVPVTE